MCHATFDWLQTYFGSGEGLIVDTDLAVGPTGVDVLATWMDAQVTQSEAVRVYLAQRNLGRHLYLG